MYDVDLIGGHVLIIAAAFGMYIVKAREARKYKAEYEHEKRAREQAERDAESWFNKCIIAEQAHYFSAMKTGVKDMNGREILEGDLLELHEEGIDRYIGVVFYDVKTASFRIKYGLKYDEPDSLGEYGKMCVYYDRCDEEETNLSELNSPENLKARADNER